MKSKGALAVATLAAMLAGCGTMGVSRSAQTKMPQLFCHDADWALSGLRTPRASFNGSKAVCAADRLRLAAQILNGTDPSHAELTRARSLIDSVQNGTEVQRDPALAGLASLLDRLLVEHMHSDKLGGQVHEQQQRIDDLNAKLSALTAIERSMAQKASKKKVGLP
jgi:hypothetical protein